MEIRVAGSKKREVDADDLLVLSYQLLEHNTPVEFGSLTREIWELRTTNTQHYQTVREATRYLATRGHPAVRLKAALLTLVLTHLEEQAPRTVRIQTSE